MTAKIMREEVFSKFNKQYSFSFLVKFTPTVCMSVPED